MNIDTKREIWVDYAKGIGIILVVIGHLGVMPTNIVNIVYTFHMPLFFFLSGYLAKTVSVQKALRITKSLLLRYVVYSLLFSISYSFMSKSTVSFSDEVRKLAFGYYESGNPAGTMWFLLVLYVSSIAFAILLRLINSLPLNLLISIVMSIAGGILNSVGHFPLRIQTALVCVLFLSLGHMLKLYKEILDKEKKYWVAMISCVGIGTVIISVFNGRVDMGSDLYGNYILFIIGAICGSVFIAMISNMAIIRARILEIIGRNSIVIYLLHIYPVMILNYILASVGISGLMCKAMSHSIAYAIIVGVIIFKEKNFVKTRE